MNYKLAKELKDAGFPTSKELLWVKNGTNWSIIDRYLYGDRGPFGDEVDETTPAPTLEELIEACEESFGDLTYCGNDYISSKAPVLGMEGRQKGGFEASTNEERSEYIFEWGETPSDAVARLWLALNETRG